MTIFLDVRDSPGFSGKVVAQHRRNGSSRSTKQCCDTASWLGLHQDNMHKDALHSRLMSCKIEGSSRILSQSNYCVVKLECFNYVGSDRISWQRDRQSEKRDKEGETLREPEKAVPLIMPRYVDINLCFTFLYSVHRERCLRNGISPL